MSAVLLGAAAAAAAAAGILAASTGRKRAPGSIPHERKREGGGREREDIPLACLLALGILVLRRSLVSQRWALPNYRLGIHNRTRRGAFAGRYTPCMVIACFIEHGMKDDAEREREKESERETVMGGRTSWITRRMDLLSLTIWVI